MLSLRQQVALLSAVVLTVLLLVVGVLVHALRSSESAVVGAEQRRLTEAAHALSASYVTQLKAARAGTARSAVTPSGAARPDTMSPLLSTTALDAITTAAVARAPGMNGGFYFTPSGVDETAAPLAGAVGPRLAPRPVLAGGPVGAPPPPAADDRPGIPDGFPTGNPAHLRIGTQGGRKGARDPGAGPARDRADVLAIAAAAARLGRDTSAVLRRPKDLIVVYATPIRDSGAARGGVAIGPGSAWVLTRVPGFRADQRQQTGWAGLALAAGALACVLLALGIARGVRRGVATLERGLAALEQDLGARVPTGGEPAELARLGAGVNRLADVLRRQIAEARDTEARLRHAERLAALGRLTAGVAHEVRNPLATMRLRAQLLEAAPTTDAAGRRAAGVIVAEADRLNALVERLLTFSRPAPLAIAPVDVAALAARRLETYRGAAAAAGVHVLPLSVAAAAGASTGGARSRGTRCGAAWAAADPDSVAQVIDNVVQNAIEALTPGGGTLGAHVAPHPGVDGAWVRLEVRDDGPGPTAEAERHALDPFFTTKARGTGLGLAISYEIVRALGGTLELARGDGPPGRPGAVVRIDLPASAPPVSAPPASAPQVTASEGAPEPDPSLACAQAVA